MVNVVWKKCEDDKHDWQSLTEIGVIRRTRTSQLNEPGEPNFNVHPNLSRESNTCNTTNPPTTMAFRRSNSRRPETRRYGTTFTTGLKSRPYSAIAGASRTDYGTHHEIVSRDEMRNAPDHRPDDKRGE